MPATPTNSQHPLTCISDEDEFVESIVPGKRLVLDDLAFNLVKFSPVHFYRYL